MGFAVAVDGPAGAGKGTITKMVAQSLGYKYIDTGAIYRTLALKVIDSGLDPLNPQDISKAIKDLNIKTSFEDSGQVMYLDGINVSSRIRTPKISEAVSKVASITEARILVSQISRELAESDKIIMEGRDIGTYVLPNAQVKIFLTASIEERARRRFLELQEKGIASTLEEVKTSMEERDKRDSSRDFAPLKIADDAVVVDSTNLIIEEVVNKIIEIVRKMGG